MMYWVARRFLVTEGWKLFCIRHPARHPNLSAYNAGSRRERILLLRIVLELMI